MKTLYVSDLDGTLLTGDQVISEYTSAVINELTEKGMIFSYATARSVITAKKVTKGIDVNIPLIVYNGAFIVNNITGEIMIANYFHGAEKDILTELFRNEVYPIVYSIIDGREKFSFVEDKCTRGMCAFLESRKGDVRTNPVVAAAGLIQGDCFYMTCIDEPEKLEPLYEMYKDQYHCVYEQDLYTKEQWLEIMPREASKSNAVLQLKERLQCDRLVVFGDGKNDIDMFEVADECYAVSNAVCELKKRATGVIGSNEEDGVARWLKNNYKEKNS